MVILPSSAKKGDPLKPVHLYLYGPGNSDKPGSGPFLTSFEAAAERLLAIRGVCLEPDGSFGFASVGGRERLFGMLYDAGGRLQYVDLQGHISVTTWRQIVIAICGDASLLNQLSVLKLRTRELKTFQSFETETWPIERSESDSNCNS